MAYKTSPYLLLLVLFLIRLPNMSDLTGPISAVLQIHLSVYPSKSSHQINFQKLRVDGVESE